MSFIGRAPELGALREPRLQKFMGLAFEELCRDHARRHLHERGAPPAQEIGQL